MTAISNPSNSIIVNEWTKVYSSAPVSGFSGTVRVVVEATNGAHPTSCDPDYRRDEAFQKTYLGTAKDQALWDAFRSDWLSFPTEADYQAALAARPAEEAAS